MVVPRELYKGMDLFRDSLDADRQRAEKAFGHDGRLFIKAAEGIGGQRISGGDAAVRMAIFPKFAVEYILWLGDDEFPAGLTQLVDQGVSGHLPLDAIIVSLNLLTRRLCESKSHPFRIERLERELFTVGGTLFIINSKPDLVTNLGVCIRYYLRNRGMRLGGQ